MPLTHITHPISRSTWRLLAAIYASMLALTTASVMWSSYVAEQSNRQWCGVLRVYHDAYANNAEPPTQLGKDVKAQMEQLYADFDCASVGKP